MTRNKYHEWYWSIAIVKNLFLEILCDSFIYRSSRFNRFNMKKEKYSLNQAYNSSLHVILAILFKSTCVFKI